MKTIIIAAIVACCAVGCGDGAGGGDETEGDISPQSGLLCKPRNRDFVACGEAGVCFNGECCQGCWMFMCPSAVCELVCVPQNECN